MTRFRCDGIFNDSYITNFQETVKMKKKFENRWVFDEVMPKILLVHFFFRTRSLPMPRVMAACWWLEILIMLLKVFREFAS